MSLNYQYQLSQKEEYLMKKKALFGPLIKAIEIELFIQQLSEG